MEITAKAVAELRAKTGCGMMDCKKALVEANGDFDEAIKVLREKGLAVAAKKAVRIAAEGAVDILKSDDGMTTAMVEINAETDFVAKNATFKAFVQDILKVILAAKPADMPALMAAPFSEGFNVEQALKDKIFTIGENMNIRRFVVVDGVTGTYIHGNGTTGVIVKFDTDAATAAKAEFAEMAKNVAMQVAATAPAYVNKEAVPAAVIDNEKNILMEQIKNDPKNASKPAAIIEKMVAGRIGKYYDTNCLSEQEYVKDDEKTVSQYIASVAKELGAEIKLVAFESFEKGEGLQKREDNFGEEIASMLKK